MTTKERWKPIQKFPGYEVSDKGRVRSLPRRITIHKRFSNKFVRGQTIEESTMWIAGKIKNYKIDWIAKNAIRVGLNRDGKEYTRPVGPLVLAAFVGPKPTPKHQCRHLDGNWQDCRLGNLAWGTHQENMDDMVRHGTRRYGEDSAKSKFSNADVVKFKKWVSKGIPVREAARRIGMTAVYGHQIMAGKRRTKC